MLCVNAGYMTARTIWGSDLCSGVVWCVVPVCGCVPPAVFPFFVRPNGLVCERRTIRFASMHSTSAVARHVF